MERLACFPHMHSTVALNGGGGLVKGKDASLVRLHRYYAFRKEHT
jgi:hypothetical protein